MPVTRIPTGSPVEQVEKETENKVADQGSPGKRPLHTGGRRVHGGKGVGHFNEVTSRPARLVLGWVTVCRWANHLGL